MCADTGLVSARITINTLEMFYRKIEIQTFYEEDLSDKCYSGLRYLL